MRIGPEVWAAAICAGIPLLTPAADLHVPGQFPTIQEAIDAARDGDCILVEPISPEAYFEALVVDGKALTLESASPEERVGLIAFLPELPPTLSILNGADVTVRGFAIRGPLHFEIAAGGVAALCASASVSFTDSLLFGGPGNLFPLPWDPPGFEDGGEALCVVNSAVVEVTDCDLTGGHGGMAVPLIPELNLTGGDGGAAISASGVGLLRIRTSTLRGGSGCCPEGSGADLGGRGGDALICTGPASIVISGSALLGGPGGAGEGLFLSAGGPGGHGLVGQNTTHICSAEVVAHGGRGGAGDPPGTDGQSVVLSDDSTFCLEEDTVVSHLLGLQILASPELFTADNNADGLVDVGDAVRVGLLDE